MSKNQYAQLMSLCCINWTESKPPSATQNAFSGCRGLWGLSFSLDSSQTHQSCLLLEGLGRVPPDWGCSPGALDICEHPLVSSPLGTKISKEAELKKPGWEAKILQLGCGFSSETSCFHPLITRPVYSWAEEDHHYASNIHCILLQHVQYPLRLHPTLRMLTPTWHTWVFISCHTVSVSFQSLSSCF